MTEIVPIPDGDRQQLAAITEYLEGELARQGRDAGGVHVHYHAAPIAPAPAPAVPTAGQQALDRAVPYFIILLGGVVILACVGTVVVLMIPALLALAVTCAIVLGGFALLAVSIAASVRSLRQSRTEQQVSASLIRRKGRR
jgi:hypothetical protein